MLRLSHPRRHPRRGVLDPWCGRAVVEPAAVASLPAEASLVPPADRNHDDRRDALRAGRADREARGTVTFVVTNAGVAIHEFFVGTEAEQIDHAAEMAMTEMSHDHRNGISVAGGETRSLTMTFPEAGSQLVGCHEIGHYDAGMSGTLTVTD